MDIILIIIWAILLLLGILGSFLPVLPGPLLSYITLILLKIIDTNYISTTSLIIRFIVIALVTILDYIIPILWTKKMWWTKRWTRGATIWLIIWVIILPLLSIATWPFGLLWIIWGPFLWALIWESLNNNKYALKAAFWSFLGFLAWTIIKLIVVIIMSVYFFQISFNIIKNYF